MPGPYASNNHVDSTLSQFAAGYTNGAFFADILCPVIRADKKSDVFLKLRRQDVADLADNLLLGDGPAVEVGYEQTEEPFRCKTYGAKARASYGDMKNQDLPIDLLEQKAAIAMNRLLVAREDRVATLLGTAGNYASGNTAAVSSPWTNTTSGTPLKDIKAGVRRMAPSQFGNMKKVFWCSIDVWDILSIHPDFQSGGSTDPVVPKAKFAEMVGVDEIVISETEKNTVNRGATPSFSRIFGTTIAGVILAPRGEPRGVTGLATATFRFMQDGDGVDGLRVRRWYDPNLGDGGSEVVQAEHSDAEKFVQNDMAYLWTSVA
ncbi:MAG: hypothetical protein MUE69_33905 [Myxococcota bacterium]|jgi:hypothetical protein|nr:hypothetical protein [Myxococcota bacterium]